MGLWIWRRLTSCVPGANAAAARRAVFGDGFRSIVRAGAAIEELVDAGRNAAIAAEEAVGDAGRLEAFGIARWLQFRHGGKPAMPPVDGGA